MMNLFSSFNPITTQKWSLNWIMLLLVPSMTIMTYWKIMSTASNPTKMFNMKFSQQFKPSFNMISLPNMLIIISILIMVFSFNIYSLIPNTFSVTSHIMINLSMSMPLWMASTIKKCKYKMKMLSNFTPPNTPYLLIPFMVLIEIISILIQPLTLSIRLTANITAGHIMLILIVYMYPMSFIAATIANTMMMLLELAVSLIQAYVFALLISMYSK